MSIATLIHPAEVTYSGAITDPARWAPFEPRVGDVIVATPSKCGTTWTQSITAMLLYGTTQLPTRLTDLSPWIDASFVPLDEVMSAIESQPGRRVIKTHTPVDGFPVWEGVKVITVFRHPLEMFLSLRKHVANMKGRDDSPMLGPLDTALAQFLSAPFDENKVDDDSIMTVVRHYQAAVLCGRLPDTLTLNYARMLRDHAAAVRQIDRYLGTGRSDETLAAITDATAFGSMKANATQFAPEAGRGFWHDDKAFFAQGRAGAWQGEFSAKQLAAYTARFAGLLPDASHRSWIETGESS